MLTKTATSKEMKELTPMKITVKSTTTYSDKKESTFLQSTFE